MAIDFATLAQKAVGVLGGGTSQVDAVALSAKAGQVIGQDISGIKKSLFKFGAKLGPNVGADFFKQVADGAASTAAPAVAAEQEKYFGASTRQLKAYGLGAVLLIGAYLLYRGRK